MDISVSRLNQRMALQLPAEFPLGLVFVVGEVDRLVLSPDGGDRPSFLLVENGYELRCCLSDRTAQESTLAEGDSIRAGGHLAFDPHYADYFLYVRDVEVLVDEPPPSQPARASLVPILEDIRRRSQAANLIPADLPTWVRRIAPPEFQSAVDISAEGEEPADLPESLPASSESSDEIPGLAPVPADGQPSVRLTDELVAFLSEAMDSPEDVELTSELMAELAPAIGPAADHVDAAQPIEAGMLAAETRVPWVVVVLLFLVLAIFFGALLVLTINLTSGG
jgi:hypothetical protein